MSIGDVECRRHFVTIFCFESTCGETDLLHHVRIDDRESFLLSAIHQHGAIHLHLIDINQVLIKRTTSHIILARQLVMRTHARLLLDQFLYGIARGGRCLLHILHVQFLCLTRLSALLRYRHFFQRLHRMHHNLYP